MTNILNELWDGEIHPQDSLIDGNEYYKDLQHLLSRNQAELVGTLSGEQKELFDLLGVKVFAEGNFGELFKNYFSNKLLLDTPDKVISFHHYLAGKRTSLSEDQASGLKNTSVLLLDHEGVAKGLNGVYIAQRDDAVVTLVESGALSRDIKVLDSRLCESEEMLKYWEWLGCKMLDSDRLMDG